MGRKLKPLYEKENLEFKDRNASLNKEIEKLKRELEEKEKKIKEKTDDLEKQKKDYTDLEGENKKLKDNVREFEEENKKFEYDLESKIAMLKEQLERKKAAVSGNFVEISIDGIEDFYTDEIKDYILSVLKKEEKQLPEECERKKHILKIIIEKNKISKGLEQLEDDIKKSAAKEKPCEALKSVFTKHVGIEPDSSKKNHYKITIRNSGRNFVEIVSLTPSDYKNNKNNVQDLMKKILLRV